MNIPFTVNVYFFESEKDFKVSRSYATISAEELTSIIQCFVSWAAMLATNPEAAELFGDASTAHIRLATDLRMAVKKSWQENAYPNVVLPTEKFKAVMTLMRISRRLQSEFAEVLANESKVWQVDQNS